MTANFVKTIWIELDMLTCLCLISLDTSHPGFQSSFHIQTGGMDVVNISNCVSIPEHASKGFY